MIRRSLLFILIPIAIFAEAIVPQISSEDNTLALLDNLVNVENGKFIQIDHDISIRGSDPFTLTRYYDNGRHFDSEFGFGMGVSIPALLQADLGAVRENMGLQDRVGTLFLFDLAPIKGKKGEFQGSLSPVVFSMGYTNCCQAQLRGEPTVYATKVRGNKNVMVVTLGDGTKRHYQFYKKGNHISQFRLIQEDRPNGNKRYYQYSFPSERIVSSIETKDRTGNLVLHRIDFDYNKNHAWIRASNGQSVDFHKKQVTEIAKGDDGKKYKYPAHVLKDRTASHLPTTLYEQTGAARFYKDLYCLREIMEGGGRKIEVQYDENHRVYKLFQGGLLQHAFIYLKDSTVVKNALGHTKTYFFSNKRLIKLVEPHKIQTNDWDCRGLLAREMHLDPQGRFVHEKTYGYDSDGRVTGMVTDGEITQKGMRDRYGIEYSYSSDELHLLQKELHTGGLTYRYQYLPGTNLRTAKIGSKDNVVFEREFYDYDAHGFLISVIKDDGACHTDKNNLSGVTFRRITEIEPVRTSGAPGLSQPKVISDYYLDIPTGKKRLLKKVERLYGKSGLVTEEKVYDAQGDFAYSRNWVYNDREELLSETNALGELSRYQYDNHGNRIFEEREGFSKRYQYNTLNLPIEEVENHGGKDYQTVHIYDAAGRRAVTYDRYRKESRYFYDDAGRKIGEKDPYGFEESYTLDIEGRMTKKIDKEGHVTRFHYNFYGDPLEIHYPDGSYENFSYTLQGHLTQKRHRDGSLEKYILDAQGRPLKIDTFSEQGELVSALIKEYKGPNLICEIDAMGFETRYEYDGAGRKVAMVEGDKKTSYGYDRLGRLTETISANVKEVKFYDLLDRVVEERIENIDGGLFSKVQYSYDIRGNQIETKTFISDSEYAQAQSLYDTQNRLLRKIDPEGAITELRYIETDHVEVETIDPLGKKSLEIHGTFDEIKEKKQFSSKGELLAATSFVYDRLLQKRSQKEKVFGNGIVPYTYQIDFVYDAMGQKILERENEKRTTTYSYDRGRLTTKTLPDGTILYYDYDPLGHLRSLTSSEGTIDYQYRYDLNGQLIEAEDRKNQTTTYRTYDRFGDILSEKQASGFEIAYSYDDLHCLTSAAFLDRKIVYTHSPSTLLTATLYRGGKTRYSYHQKCDLRGKILENGLFNTSIGYHWDKDGRLISLTSPKFSEEYRYDLVGNMVAKSGVDPKGAYDSQFSYDDLYQLTEERGPFTHSYNYDSLFNRRRVDGEEVAVGALNQVNLERGIAYE